MYFDSEKTVLGVIFTQRHSNNIRFIIIIIIIIIIIKFPTDVLYRPFKSKTSVSGVVFQARLEDIRVYAKIEYVTVRVRIFRKTEYAYDKFRMQI